MKLFFSKFFPAITIYFSRLAIWFILLFSLISINVFATDYTITVTATGSSSYIFNSSGLNISNANDPPIFVTADDKLIFDMQSSSLATHPLAIVSELDPISNGYNAQFLVDGVINNNSQGTTITWDLIGVTPGEYWYVCVNHPDMRGKITVSPSQVDSDADGVPDFDDEDDDNDGITDVIEGGDTEDFDNDGLPNRIDPDSDNDNCFDVVESGYGDLDNDGIIGIGTPDVDDKGRVNNQTYKFESEISDLDGNGKKDFLEKGSTLSKVSDPSSVTVLESTNATFTSSGTTEDDLGTISYSWQITVDNNVWKDIDAYIAENQDHPGTYQGTNTTTLSIISVTPEMSGFKYRLFMETPAYACDLDITSSAAQLTVKKIDTDGDNVPDEDDLDDDNDGIEDLKEGGETMDSDFDGVPNRIDLDSDNDGCFDVLEAGFTDGDNDGKVGVSIVQVDIFGKVFAAGGIGFNYDTPSDADNSGTYDFIEYGGGITSYSNPNGIVTTEGAEETFTVSTSSTSEINYQWQISIDNGISWSNLTNTDAYSGVTTKSLTVSPVSIDMNGYQFKLIMSTPSYVCGPVVETAVAQIVANPDFDGDGVADDVDLDDDNDGITDVFEGGNDTDFDNDGIPNRLDLDSDNDGCNDVREAGYTDFNGDGILGGPPYQFNEENGLVEGSQEYKAFDEIDDLDFNGKKDYLERGTALSKTSDPSSVTTVEYSKVTLSGGGATVDNVGTIIYSWQISTNFDDPINRVWTDVSYYITQNPDHPGVYSGLDSTTIVIDSVLSSMDKFAYRLFMETPAFKCDGDVTSNSAQIRVYKQDTDGDQVPDELDLDDDNDGIKDEDEGEEDEDTDDDGIPNRLDRDSDGDGCDDVIELGGEYATDDNNDGKVGIPLIQVDDDGLVLSHGDGIYVYNDPVDSDGDGVYDFKQVGSYASVFSDGSVDGNPSDLSVQSNGEAIFVAKGSSDGTLAYKWQVSTDEGTTFTDIEVYDNEGEQSEIMIVGGGFPRMTINKAFLEIYANTDIPRSTYKLRMVNQAGSGYEKVIDKDIKAGDFVIFNYGNTGRFTDYFGSDLGTVYGTGKYHHINWNNLHRFYFDNRFEIVKISDGSVVDTYGKDLEDTRGYGYDDALPWAIPYGYFKRKDNRYATSEYNANDWEICRSCLDSLTNDKSSKPYPLKSVVLPDTSLYTGINDDTLKINAVPRNFDRYQYQAVISTVGFACDIGTETEPAELIVFIDTDGDGVGDVDDLDDDNDGILDNDEGELSEDYDNDGIPNRLDLDSDNDGCFDVSEAGFTDPDGDGIFGQGNPQVNSENGKIISHSYPDPQDVDLNTVDDFLETNYDAGIFTHPVSTLIDEEDDTILVSQASIQTDFTIFWNNYPLNTVSLGRTHAIQRTYNWISNVGWHNFGPEEVSQYFVVEFDSLISDPENNTITGLQYMFQYRGHSYYWSPNRKTFYDAAEFAQSVGGYLVVMNDTYENELVREWAEWKYNDKWIWINHYRDPKAPGYKENDEKTGWVSGYIPNSPINYQWQVGVVGTSDTTWTNITDGTHYSGTTNDTLKLKAVPDTFADNLYRLKATPKSNACAVPVYSDPAKLTVSSDPDQDGVKNSLDLDDDNDGILDTDEGGNKVDTDGDGIPNRLDLDSDNDGCSDAQEAGFTGYDDDGRLCAAPSCADDAGRVNGHDYNVDPLDGDNSGRADFLEVGQSPTITTDLLASAILANGSPTSLGITATIPGMISQSEYTNWQSGEPNNHRTQDYAYTYISNGYWDDRNNGGMWVWEVVEFNNTVKGDIPGYNKLIADFNGHSYYISKQTKYTAWTTSRDNAKNIGGYLVVLNSEEEKQRVYEAVRSVSTSYNYWIGHFQNRNSPNFTEPKGGWEWVEQPSTIGYTWQMSVDSTNWTSITADNDTITVNDTSIVFTNYDTASIAINPVIYGMDGYQFRVIATNPGFACAVADTSKVLTIIVEDDFDGDGIRDELDLDDDNDGILDSREGGEDLDTDGDGMPNRKDLDSDNDGCPDVDEAYGTTFDPDRNKIFGDSSDPDWKVDANGRVVGYTNTYGRDLDGNGVYDYLEAGAEITSVVCPDPIVATEGSSVNVVTAATGQGDTFVDYRWEISSDSAVTWTAIEDVKLMIIGMGQASRIGSGRPKFIELLVLQDMPGTELNKHWLYSFQNGNTTSSRNYGFPNDNVKKGDRILLSFYPDEFEKFFEIEDIDDYYDVSTNPGQVLDYGMRDGNDVFVLTNGYKNFQNSGYSTDGIVDIFGNIGEDGEGKDWEYKSGWVKRKGNKLPSSTFDVSDWNVCNDCFGSVSTNASASNSYNINRSYSQGISFDNTLGDSLTISDIDIVYSGYQFRAIVSTPSFACGENDTTCAVTLTVVGDNDRDGIPDETDIDDDNDGILDSVEGEDTDTDGDGILDKFDLDSDNDGCKDVIEAGFSDNDDDGIFGEGTPDVTGQGGIDGHNYPTPADADGNNKADYLEPGSVVTINSYRDYFLSGGGDTAQYYVDYTVTGTANLHWEVSTDGNSWSDIDASDDGTGSTGDTDVCTNSNWGSSPWTWDDGELEGTIKNVIPGTDIDIKINDNSTVDWVTNYPRVVNNTFGGVNSLGINLDPKSGSGESTISSTISFSSPVNGLSILLTDIDSEQGKWKDKVVITSDAGNPTAESINTNPTFTIDGNTLTAKEDAQSNADNKGTARLTFPGGVTTITIVYTDVSGIIDPDIRGIGIAFENICVNTGSANYDGVYNDTLSIYDVKQGMDEWRYRLRIETPAYLCEDTVWSDPARLDVDADYDNDGILNVDDVDDDNDGILDKDEGEGDFDGDGIKNRFDLDSDNDGCNDVTEAGFTDKVLDENSDGILGDSPYSVDSEGRITSGLLNDGYSTPNDLDNNGNKDFLQYGQSILNAVMNNSELTLLASETGSFKITADVPSGDQILYQWQESTGGDNWLDIPEIDPYSGTKTSELTLTQPDATLSGNKYRVLLTIPSYVCAVVPLIPVDLIVHPDEDKDGVRDLDDDDDDNDGILDIYEYDGNNQNQDNDQDGIPNRFDLDSDNDGCPDVTEAGFTDLNGDSLVGPDHVSTMFVDSTNSLGNPAIDSYNNSYNGRVNDFASYDEPFDLDNDGQYDFLQEGSSITAVECPNSVIVEEGEVAVFSGLGTNTTGDIAYQWEISSDSGKNWSDIPRGV